MRLFEWIAYWIVMLMPVRWRRLDMALLPYAGRHAYRGAEK
jgi:hypothetical protein